MKRMMVTVGCAVAAIALLAACHGTNQGEEVSVPGQSPSVTTGDANISSNADADAAKEATFRVIKGIQVRIFDTNVKDLMRSVQYTYDADGRVANVENRQTAGDKLTSGTTMAFEYDDQGRVKAINQKLIPIPPDSSKPPFQSQQQVQAGMKDSIGLQRQLPPQSFKFTYDAEGREQAVEVYDHNAVLFGTWTFAYASAGSSTDKVGSFKYQLPSPKNLSKKSVATFDANGNMIKFSVSTDEATPKLIAERVFAYTADGALLSMTEKLYNPVSNTVRTTAMTITYKTPGVPEKLTATVTEPSQPTVIDAFSVLAADGDVVTQAVLESSTDNGATFAKKEEVTATYDTLTVQPTTPVGIMFNYERTSVMPFMHALLFFANHPQDVLGGL